MRGTRIVLFLLTLILCRSEIAGQFSQNMDNSIRTYYEGVAHFEGKQYDLAEQSFQSFLGQRGMIHSSENANLTEAAELFLAKCALFQEKPQAERLFVQFIRSKGPSARADEAAFDLANYYFSNRQYDLALKYFGWIEGKSFSGAKREELHFKTGYSHFSKKEYRKAIESFTQVNNSEFYDESCYYAGYSHYYMENYDQAVAYWQVAAQSRDFENSAPINIAQVYFAQKQYDQVAEFVTPYLKDKGVIRSKEIKYLAAKSYFETGRYDEAYPLFEAYAKERGRMTMDDYYQLGYLRYRKGEYQKAADVLVRLDNEKSAMGQSAMYYLADCFTRLNDKPSARNAFYRVSRLDYDTELQQEALLNYAKISAELGFDIEALKALLRYTPASPYYIQAQDLSQQILETTNDTKRALNLLEKMKPLPADLKESYQVISYRQALKEFNLNNLNEAKDYLSTSLTYGINNRLKGLAHFWLAEIHFRQNRFEQSLENLSQYFTLLPVIRDIPPTSSSAVAYYNQGYNYMKLEKYGEAEKSFNKSFAALANSGLPEGAQVQMASDAGMRLADGFFVRKDYNNALRIYDENIEKGYRNKDYALYQKATIQGLQGDQRGKINTLDRLLAEDGDSKYSDQALLSIGDTYMEIGRPREALDALQRLVSQYKGRSTLIPQALLEMGLVNYNLGSIEAALANYKAVFDNNPSSQEARNALSAIKEIYLVDLEDPDGYLAFEQRATGYKSSESRRDSLNYEIAYNLYEQGEYDKAIVSFDSYLLRFPNGLNVLEAQYLKSESLSILKRYAEAVEGYEYCILKGQNQYFESSLRKAALIHYNYTQNFQRAFENYRELEKVTLADDVKNEAQIGAFRSAYRLGLERETLAFANKIINNPQAGEDLKTTAKFYLGKVEYDNQKYRSARQYLSEVVATGEGENWAEAKFLLADITYKTTSADEAEGFVRQTLGEINGYPYWVARTLLMLTDILIDKGDIFNARAAVDALLENYADDAEITELAIGKREKINALEANGKNSESDDDDE